MKTVLCHVCGKLHRIKADFLSGNTRRHTDGKEYIIHSCGKHTAEEIRKAYFYRK